MDRIRLSSSASVTPTEVGILLRSDLGTFQIDGSDLQVFIGDMLPLLDGTRDEAGVADVLEGYSRQSVLGFLNLMMQYGLLVSAPPVPETAAQERWRGQEEFLRKWVEKPDLALQRVRDARILIVGLEPWGVVAALELAAAGVGTLYCADDGAVEQDDLLSVPMWSSRQLGHPRRDCLKESLAWTAPWCSVTTSPIPLAPDHAFTLPETRWDVIIAAVTADDLLVLDSLARYAHTANVLSLFGHLDGLDAVVGPVVVPGQTACWNCCRLRHLANSSYPEAAHALQASLLSQRPTSRSHTYLAPMASLLGHLMALETFKLISRYTPSKLVGRLLVQDLVTLETTLHTVIRMPWCDICGGASQGGTVPPGGSTPRDVSAGAGEDAGSAQLQEASTPEEVRIQLEGWVDDRVGVIRNLSLGMPDGTDLDLPVTCSAIRGTYTEGVYQPGVPDMGGGGKGLTTIEAMIGAVGEAIERYSAARYRKSDLYRTSYANLQADAFDPRRLCLYDDAQYADPQFPFARFDPQRAIDWTRGYWLDSGEPTWLPALPTYIDFQADPAEYFCQVTSNGLAAGSSLADASLRAVFELVERDAFMLTWLCQRPGRRLTLDGSLETAAHEVVRQLKEQGADTELYLLDTGVSIPTVVCLGLGDGKRWPGATVSLAAHLNPRIAIRKAILEQGHVGPYIRHHMLHGEQPIPNHPEDVHTLTDHALYYVPPARLNAFDALRATRMLPTPLAALAEPADISLQACIERLAADGIRVAIADVTSPDVATGAFRVARALGTYMQPIDFGYKLRRLANPRIQTLLTNGLNPYPHPLA